MPRYLWPAVLSAAALALAGCWELDEVYTLNPDGTGKVEVTMTGRLWPETTETPEQAARRMLARTITTNRGVEAWAGLECKGLEDGHPRVKATVYFPDLGLWQFRTQAVVTREEGRLILWPMGRMPPTPPVQEWLSEEELAARVAALKEQWAKLGSDVVRLMQSMSTRRRFIVSGRVLETAHCRRVDEHTVQIEIDGPKLAEACVKIVTDEGRLRELASRGIELTSPTCGLVYAWVAEELLGSPEPPRAVIELDASAPLFDYAKEVAAAREAMPEAFEQAGVTGALPEEPPAGEGFERIQVVGMRWQKLPPTVSPKDRWRWPDGSDITLLGTLPGKVLSAGTCRIDTATDTDGRDLTSAIFSAKASLEPDRAHVQIEIVAGYPPEALMRLHELSGTLVYLSPCDLEDVDLGFEELWKGTPATGGARIVEMTREESGGAYLLVIEVRSPPGIIEGGRVQTAEGRTIATLANPPERVHGRTTLIFKQQNPWPEDGRVVLRRYTSTRRYTIPFRVTDVSLLPPGRKPAPVPAEKEEAAEAPSP